MLKLRIQVFVGAMVQFQGHLLLSGFLQLLLHDAKQVRAYLLITSSPTSAVIIMLLLSSVMMSGTSRSILGVFFIGHGTSLRMASVLV